MGKPYILENSGFNFRPLKEGKKDDISNLLDEIIQSEPKYKEYIKNKYKPFLDYTISSDIGIYLDENLGDIHFFSEKYKDIFNSTDLKSHQKYIFQKQKFFL